MRPLRAFVPAPAFRVTAVGGYLRPARASSRPVDLRLDSNESPALPSDALDGLRLPPAAATHYPDAGSLERELAERLGIDAARVVVTAGADDALNRIAMALIEPGRNAVITAPTFEMIPRYVRHAGGEVREVAWMSGAFPVDEMIAASDADTRAAFVVSPNNPTGSVATRVDVERLRAGLPATAALVIDAAYEEFADEALTEFGLTLPGTVVTRTFSKVMGLAGLRVGYAAGDERIIAWLRQVGQPYAVSGVSLELVGRWLDPLRPRCAEVVARVRSERIVLGALLQKLGADPLASQANFVLARFERPAADVVARALAERGIAVRSFPARPGLERCLRITCPAESQHFERLCAALVEACSASVTTDRVSGEPL